ncbi:MAG: PASTA domain-containing protein [Planctomycetota bacterium]|nr:PASTA domain-containing protein [Planctomycetota bacterium]
MTKQQNLRAGSHPLRRWLVGAAFLAVVAAVVAGVLYLNRTPPRRPEAPPATAAVPSAGAGVSPTSPTGAQPPDLTLGYLPEFVHVPPHLRRLPTERMGPDPATGVLAVLGELLVSLRDGKTEDDLRREITAAGLAVEVVGAIPDFGLVQVDVARLDTVAAQAALEKLPSVAATHLNAIQFPQRDFNDPLLADAQKSWGLRAIHAPEAWERTRGEGATAAIVDDGCDPTHPDLQSHLAAVLSFAPGDRQDTAFPDAAEHGTHVMGTIGAIAGNNEGTAGVAPEARLISVQVFYRHHDPATGEVDLGPTLGDVAGGINEAIAQGAQVINLSLGPQYKEKYGKALQDPARRDATVRQILAQRDRIRQFYDVVLLKVAARGVICVVAAGNDRLPANWSPLCASPLTLGVGAVGPNDSETTFSNYEDLDYQDGTGHRSVTLCAPGKDIWSTRPVWSKASYGPESGTSMAAPHVTGAVALLKSIAPSSTLTDVREVLVRTARPINMQRDIGPLLDVNAAVEEMLRRRDAGELLPPAPPDPPEDEQLLPPGFVWPPQPPLIVIQLGPQRGGWLGRLIRFLIDRFLRTARPLDGGQFDEWGRWILWPRWVTQGPPPDARGRDRFRYVWDNRARLATTTNGSLERWLIDQLQAAVRDAEQTRGKNPLPKPGDSPPSSKTPLDAKPKHALIQVPNVVGQTGAEARQAIASGGLVPKFQVGNPAPAAEQAGRVYSQEPAAGTEVAEQAAVRVMVYGEPEKHRIRVPDVAGMDEATARLAISNAKLVPQVAKGKLAFTAAQASQVYSQEPAAGSEVAEQTTVHVMIYGKPEKHTIKVPDVVRMDYMAARQVISGAKLVPQVAKGKPAPTAAQASRVYSQEPAAGSEVAEQATVHVMIYGDPEKHTIKVPDVIGRTALEARQMLTAAKLLSQFQGGNPARTAEQAFQIYRQEPAAGTEVDAQTTVRVTLYGQPEKPAIKVPDVNGRTAAEARQAITAATLQPKFQLGKAAPTAAQAERVYRQQPAAGSQVEAQTIVQMTIYGGPEKSTVRVPDVMGWKCVEAQKAIKDAKLAPLLEAVLVAPTPDKVSRVYRQRPAAGSLVEEGATIWVTVYDKPPKPPLTMTGNWKCECGGTWHLQQNGRDVTGHHDHEDNRRSHSVTAATFDGKTFRFSWQRKDGHGGTGEAAPANEAGTRFNFYMRDNTNGKDWKGTMERSKD